MSRPIHQRIDKAVAEIEKRGLDGLIVYSNGSYDILAPKFLYYFAGFRPLGPRNAAVVNAQGQAALLIEPGWDVPRVAKTSWIEDVRAASDFDGDLAALIEEFKIRKAGVAAINDLTEDVYATLESLVQIVPADDAVTEMALEKSEREVEAAIKAGKMADAGFDALMNSRFLGRTEYEILAEVEFAMRCAGADDIFNFISTEKHNQAMHSPTDKRVAFGDVVISELTTACEGQFVQLCRTVSVGKPEPVLAEKYALLCKAQTAALSQVLPGNRAGNISVHMNKVLSDAGYAKYCYPPYMRARGHGIGVGSVAPGAVIDDDTSGILRPNQAVVVHPNQYLPETGYLACGETVLVTETGMRRLSETETKLYIVEV